MTYVPKHPSLFGYDPAHLDPALVAGGDPLGIVSEKASRSSCTPAGCRTSTRGAISAGTAT